MNKSERQLSHDRLLTVLEYSPDTGLFHWKVSMHYNAYKGEEAGSICKESGYVIIGIDGHNFSAHRLAHFYMTKEWPKILMDHKNRIRNDNRWFNIRPAGYKLNAQNRSSK